MFLPQSITTVSRRDKKGWEVRMEKHGHVPGREQKQIRASQHLALPGAGVQDRDRTAHGQKSFRTLNTWWLQQPRHVCLHLLLSRAVGSFPVQADVGRVTCSRVPGVQLPAACSAEGSSSSSSGTEASENNSASHVTCLTACPCTRSLPSPVDFG